MNKLIIVLILLVVLITGCTNIENSWEMDGIELRQHEVEGSYGCFGCNTPQEGPAMCIDPILEMKQIEETPQRYCNSNFEVIEI